MTEHREQPDEIRIALDDATELAEMLSFLGDWLDGHDTELLAASFRNFVGTTSYDLAELQADIDRFTFLLGDNGEQLVKPEQH